MCANEWRLLKAATCVMWDEELAVLWTLIQCFAGHHDHTAWASSDKAGCPSGCRLHVRCAVLWHVEVSIRVQKVSTDPSNSWQVLAALHAHGPTPQCGVFPAMMKQVCGKHLLVMMYSNSNDSMQNFCLSNSDLQLAVALHRLH